MIHGSGDSTCTDHALSMISTEAITGRAEDA
jgi:hypothetical protein